MKSIKLDNGDFVIDTVRVWRDSDTSAQYKARKCFLASQVLDIEEYVQNDILEEGDKTFVTTLSESFVILCGYDEIRKVFVNFHSGSMSLKKIFNQS